MANTNTAIGRDDVSRDAYSPLLRDGADMIQKVVPAKTNETLNGEPNCFQLGDWGEVRPFSEILATLDAQGRCDGLPFMPEMVPYCGRRFRVYRKAAKVFLDWQYVVARLKNTVFLEGVRCSGESHGGCEMGCLIFWKEAWLRPATADESAHATTDVRFKVNADLRTTKGAAFCCQGTELANCTTNLRWWDVRQYFDDFRMREICVKEWTTMMALLAYNSLRQFCGFRKYGNVFGCRKKTVEVVLDLQPGEWVQVRSREEIEATLDIDGRNRGLGFGPEMAAFFNRRFRVLRRVERIVVEWSGEIRTIANTVILDGTDCTGMAHRCCPRNCHHLWREAWLKRVE